MEFRPYQQRYINNIQINKSNLCIASMRAGKSLILKGIIDKYFQGKKVLILVGIRHVILQLATYYDDCTFILSGQEFDHSKHIHLGTFQTLQRRDIDLSEYDMIAIDEIHQRFNTDIVKEIRALPCTRIFLTGTPLTNSNRFLSDEFDNILEFTNIKQMIDDGYLAQTKFLMVGNMLTAESEIKVRNGEYVNEDIDRIIDKTALIDWLINDNIKYEWSTKHKAIMYTNSIETTNKIVAKFNSPDIRAIHSKLGKTQVEEVMQWFNDTPNGIIVNCRMLTVGVDIPSADTVIYLLPTKIHSLFLQSVFRASTKFGDKIATVYDYSGMLNKVNPYTNKWRKAKLSCPDECAKQFPNDKLAQYFCLESCKSEPILVPCTGKLPYSLHDNPFISNFTIDSGRPCGESKPVWEFKYAQTEPDIGTVRKWSKCSCGCVTYYDVQTLTKPSEMIQVYSDDKPINNVTVIYDTSVRKALAFFDDVSKPKYKVFIFDSSEELYTKALDFFKSKPFQIVANRPMPRLPHVAVNRGLDAAIPLIKWDSPNTSFVKKLIKAKMSEIVPYLDIKQGYIYYQLRNITSETEKSVLQFLNQPQITRNEFLSFFGKLSKD